MFKIMLKLAIGRFEMNLKSDKKELQTRNPQLQQHYILYF